MGAPSTKCIRKYVQVMDDRISREECEEGEEPCDVCQEQRNKEERRVLRAQIIRRLDREYHDSGVVLAPSSKEESGKVSFDPGFQHKREGQGPGVISVSNEL